MTKKFINKNNSSFGSDVFRLVTGTGAAQLIIVLGSPILTRLFGPEEFGIAAIFISIVAIPSVIACMAYEQSIVLPNNDEDAANLLAISLIATILMTSMSALAISIAGDYFIEWLNIHSIHSYLWLIPPAIFFNGLFSALSYWNTRNKKFTRISIGRITSAFVNTFSCLGAGILGHTSSTPLIIANVAGQALASAMISTLIWRDNGKFFIGKIRISGMIEGLKRHKKFPLYTTWSLLLNTGSWQLPTLMFSFFFNPMIVGFYSIGFRILQMPMALVGRAIGQVFLQRAAKSVIAGDLTILVEKLFHRLLILSLLPCLILIILGEDLFILIFGDKWGEAGVFAQLLAPWACIWFIASPLSTIYYVVEKQKEELEIEIIIFITRFASILMGGIIGEPRVAVALFALTGIFAYGYLTIVIFKFAQIDPRHCLTSSISGIRSVLLYFSPIIILDLAFDGINVLLMLTISIVILILFYWNNRQVLLTAIETTR